MLPNLVIVGQETEDIFQEISLGYRGVSRLNPLSVLFHYYETNKEIEEIFNLIDKGTETDSFIHDIDLAIKERDLYNSYAKDTGEILEVVYDKGQSVLNGKFLGYEIIGNGYYSSNLRIILPYSGIKEDLEAPFYWRLQVISSCALSDLNRNLLFSNYWDAMFILKLLGEIHHEYNRYPKHLDFQVASIFLIDDEVLATHEK